jgi:hypothetical protein
VSFTDQFKMILWLSFQRVLPCHLSRDFGDDRTMINCKNLDFMKQTGKDEVEALSGRTGQSLSS